MFSIAGSARLVGSPFPLLEVGIRVSPMVTVTFYIQTMEVMFTTSLIFQKI